MSQYLEKVDSPAQVKKLTLDQLQKLAEEIRQELITGLSRNGGHLGPNLGVVELTIALHYVFSTPKDKFFLDVSPHRYVSKIVARPEKSLQYHSHHRRTERLRVAHGEPARLLRRWARGHGAVGGAGHVRGARP